MTGLLDDLAVAEATVDRIKREIANGPCREYGHTWKSIGGMNAGCELGDDCRCSVPVHDCTKCTDCDYGENDEAREIRQKCAERRAP